MVFLILKFLACMLVYFIITSTSFYNESIYPHITSANASISAFILKLLGFGTTSMGDSINSAETAISVRKGCDALTPTAIYVSILAAYPAKLFSKFKGILIGIALLLSINIIRIVSLFIMKLKSEAMFDLFHLTIWQIIFIFLALLMCFLWIRSVNQKEG